MRKQDNEVKRSEMQIESEASKTQAGSEVKVVRAVIAEQRSVTIDKNLLI